MHMEKIMTQTADLAHKSTGELDRKGQVRFASVEWGANTELSRKEGIETLPTTRFYFDGKLVEEITGGTKNIHRVKEVIAFYTQKQQERSSQEDLESTLNEGNALVVQLLKQASSDSVKGPVARIASSTHSNKARAGMR
jgi:thioredoxin-like negative regulator of GroEL